MVQIYNSGNNYFYRMQMKLRLFRFILIVFFTACGIVSLALIEIFGRDQAVTPLPVPQNANWIVRVDAATLIKEEALTVLFDARDEELLQLIRTIADEELEKSKKRKPLYIDLLNEMTVFGLSEDGHTFTGVSVKLDNQELFRENVKHYLKKNQTFSVKDNYGIILFKTDDFPISIAEQQKITDRAMSGAVKTERKLTDKGWIAFESKKAGNFAKDLHAGISIEGKDLICTGRMTPLQNSPELPKFTVKQKGLYISSAIVPPGISDSLNRFLPPGKFKLPKVKSFSLDYNGIKIENTTEGIMQLPNVNAVITSETAFSVQDVIAGFPEEFRMPGNTLKIGSETYFLKQLEANTIFIGLDTLSITADKSNEIAAVRGNLNALVFVEADQLILMGMNMIVPQIVPFSKFTAATEKINFSMVKKGNIYSIDGKMTFREGKNPMAEITKLLLGLERLN